MMCHGRAAASFDPQGRRDGGPFAYVARRQGRGGGIFTVGAPANGFSANGLERPDCEQMTFLSIFQEKVFWLMGG